MDWRELGTFCLAVRHTCPAHGPSSPYKNADERAGEQHSPSHHLPDDLSPHTPQTSCSLYCCPVLRSRSDSSVREPVFMCAVRTGHRDRRFHANTVSSHIAPRPETAQDATATSRPSTPSAARPSRSDRNLPLLHDGRRVFGTAMLDADAYLNRQEGFC